MSATHEVSEPSPPARRSRWTTWISFLACTLLTAWAAPALRDQPWHSDPDNGVVLRWLSVCLEHPVRSMTGIALLALGLDPRPRPGLTQAERTDPGSRGGLHI